MTTTDTPDLLLPQAMLRIEDLKPHPENPRKHDATILQESVKGLGLYRAIVVNKGTITGRPNEILAGHGTVNAARANKLEWVQVSYVDVDEEKARRILAIDNRASDLATYDNRLLAELLGSLPDLDYTGYNQDALDQLLHDIDIEDPDPGDQLDDEPDDAPPKPEDAMALAGVVVGDPAIKTHHGEVWRLGEHHHLVVADVHTDHALYTPLLQPESLFWPYPTLLAPFAEKAKARPVVMVQPSNYLAGWLLVKWKRVTGAEPERISQ